jgi:isoleucyl-tRNA synthetase
LPTGDEVLSTAEDKGIKVAVLKASGEKCARCWKYRTDIGANAKYADICAPCADAIS